MQQLHKPNCEWMWFIGGCIYCTLSSAENESSDVELALQGLQYAAEVGTAELSQSSQSQERDPLEHSQNNNTENSHFLPGN